MNIEKIITKVRDVILGILPEYSGESHWCENLSRYLDLQYMSC